MGFKAERPRGDMDEAELLAARKADNRRKYMRQLGRPARVLPTEFAQAAAKVRGMHAGGMTMSEISEATGGIVCTRVIGDMIRGTRKSCYRQSLEAILAAPYTPTTGFGARTPACGSARRLQALRAAGFPLKSQLLADLSGIQTAQLQRITNNNLEYVFHTTHTRIRDMYEKLEAASPQDHGITETASRKAKTWAAKERMAPPMAWDDDTIDDPSAFPDWTGACGTLEGYYLHLKYDMLVQHYKQGHTTTPGKMRRTVLCKPCRTARSGSNASMKIYPDDVRADALDDIDAGHPVRRVAEKLGCSTRTIERFKRERREGYVPVRGNTQ